MMRLYRRFVDWWNISLEHRLRATSVSMTLFFVILLGGFSYLVLLGNTLRSVVQTNQQFSEVIAKDISDKFHDTIDHLRFSQILLNRVDSGYQSLADVLFDLRRAEPSVYRGLYLFDPGTETAYVLDDVIEEADFSAMEGIPGDVLIAYEAAAGGVEYVSDVTVVDPDQMPVIVVGVPIFDTAGDVSRVVIATVELLPFWQQIDEVVIGGTGNAYIVSRQGTIIAHPNRAYVGQPLPSELSPLLDGYTGFSGYRDSISGQNMLASFSPVDRLTGWGVVVAQERSEAFAVVNYIVYITAGLILLAILAAAAATQLVSRTISGPLARLAAETRQRARTGDLTREIVIHRDDEIAQVSEAFNLLMASARRTEAALRESERRFREFFENDPEACFIATTGGVVTDVNRAAIEAYGYSRDELIGRALASLADYGQRDLLDMIVEVLEDSGEVRDVEIVVRGKLGEKRIVLVSATLIGGDPQQVIVVQRDITARKQAEEEVLKLNMELEQRIQERTRELRQTTEHVQTILDHSPEVLLFLNREGVVESVNPALETMFGYQPAEMIGRAPFMLFEQRDVALWTLALRKTIRQHATHRIELNARRKNGSVFDADVVIAPVAGDGELLGMVCSLRDISALKDVERMKDAIVSTAAHELRTPLTSIRGFSEILLSRDLDRVRRTRYLEFINERSIHLSEIIDDLLDISRLESGRGLEIDPQPVDLGKLIREAMKSFVEANQTHQIVLSENSSSAAVLVKGDSLRLSQVITNLLSNAVKYSPDGGVVRVSCASVNDTAEIRVIDHGLGIPARHLSHIFERFYRVDVSNRAIGGTGLGLSICRLIIEGHGGQIDVESEVGKGSTFIVTLPCASDDNAPVKPPPEPVL